MGKDYQLYISFPSSYSTKDTTSYPVLYVLDGLQAFPMIRGAQNVLSFGKEIEDVIIVGIGSGGTTNKKLQLVEVLFLYKLPNEVLCR